MALIGAGVFALVPGLSDATVVAGGFALVAAIIVVATVRRRVGGPVKTG